ncbi:MAG: O-antigen ligase family protein [Roseiarcus sp.]|jgi:O-antigen ligase
MSRIDFSAARRIRFCARGVFFAAIAWTVLAYGSAAEAPAYVATIVFALLAALSVVFPIDSPGAGRLFAGAIGLLAALLLCAIIQILPAPAGLANEAWRSVNELVGPTPGAISVAPGMTIDALPRLALPFLVFLSALAWFQGDAGGLALWRGLAYFGAAYAAFGILQELLLPDQLLFAPKRFYLGSLTASFVNRNTAGTFFGIALMLNLGLGFRALRNVRLAGFARKALALEIGWRDENGALLLHALLCLIVALALFLTQSRGAVGASFAGAVAGVAMMTARPVTGDAPNPRLGERGRAAAALAGVLLIVALFALFADRSVHRLETQGVADARWCSFASTLEAIEDHPLLGTGFGAFQDVFPAYRKAECAGIHGVWDHAHNFFLEGYLGLGLPFAIALCAGYGALVGVGLQGLRRRRRLRFAPAMGLASLLLASLHAIVDFSPQIPGFAVYFAAVMASTLTISTGAGAGARALRGAARTRQDAEGDASGPLADAGLR